MIDFEKLKYACFACKETMPFEVNKGYNNPTSVFLKHLFGFEPDYIDKKLADSIYLKYEFNIDVLNYLLEYCNDANDKKINSNYVNRVASTVKQKKINTIEGLKSAKRVEFKSIDEKDHIKLDVDSKSINDELNAILNKRN